MPVAVFHPEEYKKMNQQPAKKEADSSSGKRKI
jgi:hypothetical protein